MPQREVLGRHLGPRAKEADERPQKESNQGEHTGRIRAEKESEGGRPEERKNLIRLEARTPSFGHLMGFWRGTPTGGYTSS